MAFLIYDLDLTVFAVEKDIEQMHPFHQLSRSFPVYVTYEGMNYASKAHLINADELSVLTEIACTEHDGIIFLTSGLWSQDLITTIEEYLDISTAASKMLKASKFYSASSEAKLFNDDPWKIREMDKNTRLKRIIAITPELQGKHFVMLDDTPMQVESFEDNPQVTAILATTDTDDKSFYQQALEALAAAKTKEQGKENGEDIEPVIIRPTGVKRPASALEESEAVSPLQHVSIFKSSKRTLQEVPVLDCKQPDEEIEVLLHPSL